MVDIIFPSMEALYSVGKGKTGGFTNGETIVINLYTGSIIESNVEDLIDLAHTHELIHAINMNMPEKEVLYASHIIYESLKK